MDSRLFALIFGNFVIGTGTMIVTGMLGALVRGLGVDVPAGGRLIAVFAITVCLGAPLLTAFASHFERRRLLVAVLASFAAAHLLAALAPGYGLVMLARVLCAVGAAMYPAMAAATASALVPPERRGQAVASAFLGFSVASVVGTPLGAWISESLGWRYAFGMVSALSLVAAAALWRLLPAGVPTQRLAAGTWRRLAGDATLLLAVAVTVIQATAQFTLNAYLSPAFRGYGAGPGALAGFLAVFGACGIAGNLVAARVMDRLGPARVVFAALCLMTTGHLVWYVADGAWPLLVVAMALWGLGCFAVNTGQQVRLIGLAPLIGPVAVALNSSALYLGMAAGAETGGHLLRLLSVRELIWFSVPVFVVALAVSLWVERRRMPPA